jgi:hypothetical protein
MIMDNGTLNETLAGITDESAVEQSSAVGVLDREASSRLAEELASLTGAMFSLLLPGYVPVVVETPAPETEPEPLPAAPVESHAPASIPVPVAIDEEFPEVKSVPVETAQIPVPSLPVPAAIPMPAAIAMPASIAVEPIADDAEPAMDVEDSERTRDLRAPHKPTAKAMSLTPAPPIGPRTMALLHEIAFLDD